MGIFCLECNQEFKKLSSLRKHRSFVHKINSEETYVQYVLNGIKPTCECGCGETPGFLSFQKGYVKFAPGHHSRISGKNNFHKNPESKIKSAKTQKEMYANGELVQWNKGLTKDDPRVKSYLDKAYTTERADKISKALTGRKQTEDHRKKNSESNIDRYKNNPSLLEEARNRRVKWLQSKQSKKPTDIEFLLMEILKEINIQFKHQYPFQKRLFDFYLPDYNTLIEADGDFYHSNPKKYIIKYEVQRMVKTNDEYKNDLCEKYGINLIRYWETDIKERPEWVIEDLKNRLGLVNNIAA